MKLTFSKKNISDKESVNNKFMKKKFFSKKVIIISAITISIISIFGAFKIKANKQAKAAQNNVKYIVLSKTNLIKNLSTSGTIKSNNDTNVYSNYSGKVKTVNVSVGDKVKAGDVLAVLDSYTLEQDIAKLQETIKNNEASTQIDLENKKKAYDDALYLYNNNLNTDIINAQADVNSTKLALDDKQKTYEYDKAMLQNGEISQDVLNKAQNDYENAKSNYDKATVALESKKVSVKQALSVAENNYKTAQINAENQTSKIDLANKQKDLANCTIVAPVDGTITSVSATVGSASNGALFKIENLDDLIVDVSVDEVDVPKIKVGQKAKITTDATGKDEFAGEVISIDPISSNSSTSTSSTGSSSSNSSGGGNNNSSSNNTNVTFTAKIKIDSANGNIKVGMNAIVNIILDEKDDIYTVPYSAVVNKNNKSSIYVAEQQNGQYVVKEIPVTKGMESDVNVEIQGEDLNDGLIVLTDTSNYKPGSIVQIKKR